MLSIIDVPDGFIKGAFIIQDEETNILIKDFDDETKLEEFLNGIFYPEDKTDSDY